MNAPRSHPITRIKVETPFIKTFEFQSKKIAEKAKPGQYLMVWIPGVDEKPMSLSHIGNKEDQWTIGVSVACVGDATGRLHAFQEGDILGIRGPHGNGFTIEQIAASGQKTSPNILLVGGGCGMAALRPLIYRLLAQDNNLTCIGGAKTKEELLFKTELEQLSQHTRFEYLASTDDGSWEFQGTASQRMQTELKARTINHIFTCGPELMMKHVFEIAQQYKISLQASLADRIIKCAAGLCGQCVLDPMGIRLCVDGPIFSGLQLVHIEDFGYSTRNKAGKRILFQ